MNYKEKIRNIIEDLILNTNQNSFNLMIFGCSTSEIMGYSIGKNSSADLGIELAEEIINVCNQHQIIPAFQCCEHLNRAIVIDKNYAMQKNLVILNAVPKPKAGGSLPSAAYNILKNPCLVQNVAADCGIDIGNTLIGMHLRPVAVPYVPSNSDLKNIGNANVVMAYSRYPYTGGPRAEYK